MTSRVVIFDYETTKKPRHLPWHTGSYAVSLAIVEPETNRGYYHVFNHVDIEDHPQSETLDKVRTYFKELPEDTVLVAHNIKFELHWLRQLGISFNCKLWCTQVVEYVLSGQIKQSYSLQSISQRYGKLGKTDRVSQYWDSGYETDEIPMSVLKGYNINDCWQTYEIYKIQRGRCTTRDVRLIELEMETVRHLSEIEWNGMVCDGQRLRSYAKEYHDRITAIDGRLRSLLCTDANFGSPEQVSFLLFGRASGLGKVKGVRATDKTSELGELECSGLKDGLTNGEMSSAGEIKSGKSIKGLWDAKELKIQQTQKPGVYVTDQDTISQLPTPDPLRKEVKALLQERGKLKKKISTIIGKDGKKGIVQLIGHDGLIHPSMLQTITRTSRLSCRKPNLQNQERSGEDSPIKTCFVSRY